MTETLDLRRLKGMGKRYARATRIALHEAFDLIANELGFPDWTKLIAASKKGWQADAAQITSVEAFVARPLPTARFQQGDPEAMQQRLAYLGHTENTIAGHSFRIEEIFRDVFLAGDGWSIRVPENPAAIPVVEYFTDNQAECPIFDPEFLQAVLEIARARSLQVAAETAVQWPRRSTKPDHNGVVRHPFGVAESNIWFCISCNGQMTGAQIADNLWHCPGCGSSPIDIFATAFWSNDGGASFKHVRPQATKDAEGQAFRMVDGRPKLNLTEDNIALLVRNALHDEASNVSEHLGAHLAEIRVHEDEVWITLDEDLWPEGKDAGEASAVAKLLGLEVELESTAFTAPFAWPGLGEQTNSTREYVEMMLDAYGKNGDHSPRSGKPT